MVEANTEDAGLQLLALAGLPGVGIATLRLLVTKFGSLAGVWRGDAAALRDTFRQARVRDAQIVSELIHSHGSELLAAAAAEVARLRERGIQVVEHSSPLFPPWLGECADAPGWLFVEGDVSVLQRPLLGVVGTRKASAAGLQNTRAVVRIAGEAGLGIVSGLADGVDEFAHQAALDFDIPQVAVLGGGLDLPSMPRVTRHLRRQIVAQGGAVVSEYLPGMHYLKNHYIERDRIQSGLGKALCVIEGKRSGGTAQAIRFARQQGRPMFGVYSGELSPDNELVSDLAAEGLPTYDLNDQAQGEALRGLMISLRLITGANAIRPYSGASFIRFYAFAGSR